MTLTIGVVLGKSLPDNSQNSNIARTVTTSSDDTNNESATSSHEETINSLEDSETIAESNSSDENWIQVVILIFCFVMMAYLMFIIKMALCISVEQI